MRMPILIEPHPALRRVAEPVTDFAAVAVLLDNLRDSARGLGLAAPQIGVSLRACIVDTSCGHCPEQVLELVNPIVRGDGPKTIDAEGCLSLPGVVVKVGRFRRVVVEYQDRHGERRRLRCGGMQARAIQHEVDHLDGVLIIDRGQRAA